ncbi:Cysteine-rich DPF motif domain-containing protein 1 [Anthophora retusa]
MECSASTSTDEERVIQRNQGVTSTVKDVKETTSGVFRCFNCSLEERFDFKGTKPPFARQLNYSEECYIMKDPFSLPNKGEVLVLGADCQFCKRPVCLGCSVYFGKRFCLKCASNNIQNLPSQLHPKIKSLMKSTDSQK